ncbi:MAG: isoaspartyl peptidase/L-asparaginase, partial [Chloroflexota bacterium]|nr:isoaspartyl peptidase/L-asparaginase [Chloroflexota bacterium]
MTGIVVASSNGLVGIEAAVEVLRQGGSALDAVIAGTRLVEANPDDHTVGYAGIPNLLGEIELDASVMEGRGLRSGAVAAVQGYQDVTDLARAVMEELPHVLIAGDGARRLAAEIGLTSKDLMTPKVRAIWEQRLAGDDGAPEDRRAYMGRVRELVRRTTSDVERATAEPPHGTVN